MLRKCQELAFQGDIALFAIGKLPEGCKKITKKLNSTDREAYGYHPTKGLVLAQGESRNHFHAFRDIKNVSLYELAANDNSAKRRLFVVVDNPQLLEHEEHDPIEFQPNVYELIFQYEYTFDEEFRRVAD